MTKTEFAFGIAAAFALFMGGQWLVNDARDADAALASLNQTDGVSIEVHARPAADGVVYTVTRKP